MSETAFRRVLYFLAGAFTGGFLLLTAPPLLADFDVAGAFAAGFVNPFASAYALDAITCWCVLAAWVVYERASVRGGWIALLLGVVPGVAVGFAVYLVMRMRQLAR